MTIWDLSAGKAIRIVKTFRDVTGTEYAEGTVLHFKSRDYLPYHDGHTVYFKEATMYLCDADDTGAIVQNVGDQYYQMVLE